MKVACYLIVLIVSVFAANAATGTNLITNGDFEQGNTGFNTGYTYITSGLVEGSYAITTSPHNIHEFYADYPDHTTDGVNMLMANGATNPDVTVWEQQVQLLPDVEYEFSFWLSTANEYEPGDINPADLQYFINNVPMGQVTAPTTYGIWIQESITWTNSPAYRSAYIRIVDTDISGWGNDFALDDISFEVVPEPATICLLVLGGLGLIRRKKQNRA
jgi:hypothetical protein